VLAPAARPSSPAGTSAVPICVFCHGGVWAAGERWQFAPMGQSLAREDSVAVIMSYSLYPDAGIGQMVEEVDDAVTWVMERASEWGSDPSRVTVVGHSAGAQLLAMALLHRAQRIHDSRGQVPKGEAASRYLIPRQFLALNGCYDLACHYEYERLRGVHTLSTLERAAGGPGAFAALSPCALLAAALDRASPGRRECDVDLRAERLSEMASLVGLTLRLPPTWTTEDVSTPGTVPDIPLEAIRLLPPVFVLSNLPDEIVPCHESLDLHALLVRCGARSTLLCYESGGHADVVLSWFAPGPLQGTHGDPERNIPGAHLPIWSQHVLQLVLGQTVPEWERAAALRMSLMPGEVSESARTTLL